MSEEVTFSVKDGVLSIRGRNLGDLWEGKLDGLPVLDLRLSPKRSSAFVLLDPPAGSGRIQNLLHVSSSGEILWRGELPGGTSTDAFVGLETDVDGAILAATWSGFLVRLNPRTGRIEDEAFTK